MPDEPPPPAALAVLGATATGKSALALAVAEALGGEIVNADALQVYRGLDVGTAKPTAEERRRVPHHLIDVLEPHETFSAGEFARRARAAIDEIRARSRLPIVVGGSGFYLRALFAGLSPVPPGDLEVRRLLRQRLAAEGLPALAAELARVDPAMAARLTPGDTQRVLRGLEVAAVSGRPLSAWLERQPSTAERLTALRIGLTVPRTVLYDRIEGRVVRMVERGWVDEVRGLLERGHGPDLPAFQAIGYRELVRHVLGEWTLARAMAEIVKATRRFAKRQETWFRREPEVTWLPGQDLDASIPRVVELVICSALWRAHA